MIYGKQAKKKNSTYWKKKKLRYDKAIRDKIPEIIEKSGYSLKAKKLSNTKFLLEMERKLLEETKEYLRDREPHELADVLEVIYRIAELRGIPAKELEKIRIKKKKARGGFKKNLFLIKTNKSASHVRRIQRSSQSDKQDS
jgi:predicted house-cleaning noncanonical NTP pyrophosphatase (MazG superfamily)